MRNLAKYFLALAVMGTGFYAAQQYRRPDRYSENAAVAARRPSAGSLDNGGQQPSSTASAQPLPVAALADVDRLPLLGADRTSAQVGSTVTGAASVAKQPTLRGDDLAEKPQAAGWPPRFGSDTSNQDTKKQTVAKPSHKKQNSKKTAVAKPQASEQNDGARDEAKHAATEANLTPDTVFMPPDFAREYRPYVERFPIGMESSSMGPGTSAREKVAAWSRSGGGPKPQKAPSAAQPRKHRIAEGDTLRRLAEKYLGSRDRYLDLFQANQDVLFDPQLIPIGVEIVIPDRTTIVAQAATGPAATGDSNAAPDPEPDAARDDWFSIPGTETE